ncbi:MAG: ATP-dependent helicase [Treponema sp.]|jgi:DNA helicase-2/ATP-dependent DNA helicase PcrA|nr:ATP-dependent helicase [Treponema sp.]
MNTGPLPDYLALLNAEQREAVFHTGRFLLILAGAGSGKTRVITTKIAYLIKEKGVDPRSILAVTFTNKAAREMADRARLIDGRAGFAMLRTFHSFGAWFLRYYGKSAKFNPGFVIYDDSDVLSLISIIDPDLSKADARQMAYGISRAKDYFISPEDPELERIDYRKHFREVYAQYEERLTRIGNVDFGDLIKKPVEVLRGNPQLKERIADRFRVIMVDEYQDANVAQFELLKELCGGETRVCVVGDDDQSIYRFRGAEVKNILEFPERFPGAQVIRLERNYRSVLPILNLASSVVDHNSSRLGKKLISERGTGKTPVLAFLPDQDEEAAYCASLIEKSVSAGTARYADWALLYRTNAQSLGFETEFLRRKIPYRVLGSLKFYEREEVKDALALLAFTVNPRDEIAFRRMVNKPARGLGSVTVDRLLTEAGAASYPDEFPGNPALNGSIMAAGRRIMESLSAKARVGLKVFFTAIENGLSVLEPDDSGSPDADGADFEDGGAGEENEGNGGAEAQSAESGKAEPGAAEKTGKPDEADPVRGKRSRKASGKKPPVKSKTALVRAGQGLSFCVARLIEDSGLAEYHSSHDEITANQRIGNLQELVNAASLYPLTKGGLLEFLEHIELDRSLEEASAAGEADDDRVSLITLHNTKGLEFKRVIMTGVEQGIFPREDKKDDELEEERRLFYVGATRAMDELYLVSCAVRRMYGSIEYMNPSIFLTEIDPSALRVIGTAPSAFRALKNAPGKDPPVRPGPAAARFGKDAGAVYGKTSVKSGVKVSSDGRWQVGERLFHDDYGYGAVTGIRETGEGPLIHVHFDTGHEIRFPSASQSSLLVKVKDD